jgi:HEAT repeat protein
MFTENIFQLPDVADKTIGFAIFPQTSKTHLDPKMDVLLANLTPDTPWRERQIAAQKLGCMRDPEALPGLLVALLTDPFWMVRCAIIQALEIIGDRTAVPTLQEVARNDGFQIVRAYAVQAIKELLS